MADRRTPLVTGEFYHIYNRGVARQPTFLTKNDYEQALLTLSYYHFVNPPMRLSRFKGLAQKERDAVLEKLRGSAKHVEIISFVFMPNHFHFLLRQSAENGISTFLSQFTNSYTRYVNTKHNRVGAMFQGVFKSVHVESDEQLIHLSRYIHLNPVVSSVVLENKLLSYPWSSLPDYIKGESSLVWLNPVLEHFYSPKEYEKFVFDQVDYGKKLENIKHLTLEDSGR